MKRRDFSKYSLLLGMGAMACCKPGSSDNEQAKSENEYQEPSKIIPARTFDVVVAGGGTAGVVAALAAARTGAKTILIESKGYTGGTITEGGTALHGVSYVYYFTTESFSYGKTIGISKSIT